MKVEFPKVGDRLRSLEPNGRFGTDWIATVKSIEVCQDPPFAHAVVRWEGVFVFTELRTLFKNWQREYEVIPEATEWQDLELQ